MKLSFSSSYTWSAVAFFTAILVTGFALFLAGKSALAQQDPVARGKYLVTAGACAECHTQRLGGNPFVLDMSKFLAGGDKFDLGPAGVVYTRNLTSDADTGLGEWTDAQIIAAIKDGLGKDGTKLVLMPWEAFRGMAESDLKAIVAYLRTVPAINNPVPPAQLNVPREVMYGEAATLAQPPGPAEPPTEPLWKGEYLAKSVLGCQGCHGPDLSGGIPPFFAPNITPDKDTGIGSWTTAQIVTAIRTGVTPDGRKLAPVMPYATAYVNLTDSDSNAVANYLKTIQAIKKKVTPPAGPPGAPPAGDSRLPYAIGALTLIGLVLLGSGLRLAAFRRPR